MTYFPFYRNYGTISVYYTKRGNLVISSHRGERLETVSWFIEGLVVRIWSVWMTRATTNTGGLGKEEILIRFPREVGQMRLWVYPLDPLAHTKARYACILEFLSPGPTPSTKGLQIPILFLHSIVSMPVNTN
jgi:hypothetical protein